MRGSARAPSVGPAVGAPSYRHLLLATDGHKHASQQPGRLKLLVQRRRGLLLRPYSLPPLQLLLLAISLPAGTAGLALAPLCHVALRGALSLGSIHRVRA